MKGQYAAATVGRTIKGARQFFKAACRAELITRSPFDDIKAGSHTDKDRQYFITHTHTQQVIAACPDAEWRLIVALSRYGGLRCPSEHLALSWADVDRERERFKVNSPKTGVRWVPIFPELRPYLAEAFEQAPDGAIYVINRYRDSNANLRTQFNRIIRRAGLEPWPKLFHNLRASRETELAKDYPIHVVCSWIGHAAAIAQKHYLQVTEQDFERAAQGTAQNTAHFRPKTAQNTAQHGTRTEHAQREKTQGILRDSSTFPAFSAANEHARRDECESVMDTVAPWGLHIVINRVSQGLAPLAIDGRPPGAIKGQSRSTRGRFHSSLFSSVHHSSFIIS
jgi:hypothetical protein